MNWGRAIEDEGEDGEDGDGDGDGDGVRCGVGIDSLGADAWRVLP